MKVIKVKEKYPRSFVVIFTLKTFGNKRFEMGQTADDELSAYALAIPRIEERERQRIEEKIEHWETIKKAMPNAEVDKEIKKLRKLIY